VGRAERITRELKRFDRELYCAESGEGKLCVYRNSTRWEAYQLDEDSYLQVARPAPFFIFALTDDWKFTGRPVDRGILPILERLRESDLQKRDMMRECMEAHEERERKQSKAFRSQAEDMFREIRPQFQKATSDINTSTVAKKDRRRLDEKKIKL
jgi:hypothetical protein